MRCSQSYRTWSPLVAGVRGSRTAAPGQARGRGVDRVGRRLELSRARDRGCHDREEQQRTVLVIGQPGQFAVAESTAPRPTAKNLQPPISGDCTYCDSHLCSQRRVLEKHNCPGLPKRKEDELAEIEKKLKGEETRTSKTFTYGPSCFEICGAVLTRAVEWAIVMIIVVIMGVIECGMLPLVVERRNFSDSIPRGTGCEDFYAMFSKKP